MRSLQTAPYVPSCMARNFKKEEINESKAAQKKITLGV
jgi:hypothetical protein